MSDNITASPLTWPHGWNRYRGERLSSRFGTKRSQGWGSDKITVHKATTFVLDELRRMGIWEEDIIISTNLVLRNDGYPRSSQRAPEDPGASVWWQLGESHQVIACDQYNRVADNLYAIGKTIEAMRGI